MPLPRCQMLVSFLPLLLLFAKGIRCVMRPTRAHRLYCRGKVLLILEPHICTWSLRVEKPTHGIGPQNASICRQVHVVAVADGLNPAPAITGAAYVSARH